MDIITILVILVFCIIVMAAGFLVLGVRMGKNEILYNPNVVDLSDLPEGARDGIKICIDIERNHYVTKDEIERKKGQ